MLHYAGDGVYDIYDTICEDNDDYAATKEKLNTKFKPIKMTAYRVHEFRESKQLSGECLDAYVTRLRTLAKDCKYADMIKK